MTTPTSLNWKTSTPEQRNDACACFMPPSDVNPIRSWHLHVGNRDLGPLLVQSPQDADQFLELIRTSTSEEFDRSAFSKHTTWEKRNEFQIVERRRSLRYSDTPGGAWHLIEQLISLGYLIIVATRHGRTSVSAERPDQTLATPHSPLATGFTGPEPFSELTAMLFLTLNGCQIEQ